VVLEHNETEGKKLIPVLKEPIKVCSCTLILFNDRSLIVKSLWVHGLDSENKGHLKANLHRWALKCPEDLPVT